MSRHAIPRGYIGTTAAADYLNTTPRYLEKLRWAGGGPPYYKRNRRVLYRYEELDAWVQAGRRTSTSDRGGHDDA